MDKIIAATITALSLSTVACSGTPLAPSEVITQEPMPWVLSVPPELQSGRQPA